ncbi:hypothetical protein [Pelagerythrobacter aerophilus]|uniref:Uncharacterized protein n=1 Tax=Pelagerythrobacter aerophilus TaxID=2306995 RepID=A0A418NM88_9SPHN|nr:hypothetical protein [Pelagerythrobacter aerophilus]RIV81483.1 hypothetical protein D2V04_00815 [Pelagerythrobacter aerophilus]
MSPRIRQLHRWTSMVFTLIVVGIFAFQAFAVPPEWLYYTPLPFLFFLMLTGIYMFIRHYRRPAQP